MSFETGLKLFSRHFKVKPVVPERGVTYVVVIPVKKGEVHLRQKDSLKNAILSRNSTERIAFFSFLGYDFALP
nr:hypothetical protein [Ectobacillus panaciterrae]